VTDLYDRDITYSDGTVIGYASMGAYGFRKTTTDFAGVEIIDEDTGLPADEMPVGAYHYDYDKSTVIGYGVVFSEGAFFGD